MKITLDISREYALVLLDHAIEDAACCDDSVDLAECEAVADAIHAALRLMTPRPSLLKPELKPF